MIIESGMKLKGRLSWEVINKDGSIDKSSGGLYDNLILNSGLDLIGPSGAVTGGGLTIIANAPNPAGAAILKSHFQDNSIDPRFLFLGALVPTIISSLCFIFL